MAKALLLLPFSAKEQAPSKMSKLVTSSLRLNSLERSCFKHLCSREMLFGKQSDSIAFWLIAVSTETQQCSIGATSVVGQICHSASHLNLHISEFNLVQESINLYPRQIYILSLMNMTAGLNDYPYS